MQIAKTFDKTNPASHTTRCHFLYRQKSHVKSFIPPTYVSPIANRLKFP